MKHLMDLRDRINQMEVKSNLIGPSPTELSDILLDMVAEMERIDEAAKYAANTAGCLANGMIPD